MSLIVDLWIPLSLKECYGIYSVDSAIFFETMFPSSELLVPDGVRAKYIYIDLVKIQALLGPILSPKRLRYSPFPL
ncbi:uncharacterized protein PHALS_05150 [Plasmopara halstedii]|uniref:Uncharacterized protein n=1 Tax=Plasmopara halstedii TaxID=4781 RepID=A0A0P1AZL2_PLAHL|nr:uncharacterized protein PHALS_05150 [Plasmopara halstedii]CEG47816.1 hypothetical protein PHALS_05150 [Plasmopara halstedii]|eukprot:XP_024584185.1 hypothetical protein PHALS_05150 [Plasmopara halstedii]